MNFCQGGLTTQVLLLALSPSPRLSWCVRGVGSGCCGCMHAHSWVGGQHLTSHRYKRGGIFTRDFGKKFLFMNKANTETPCLC